MNGKGDMFSSLDHSYKSSIKLGDDIYLEVSTKGVMEVNKIEEKKRVHDIYYTINLKHNLLSVGQSMEKNYKLLFEDIKCVIYDNNHRNKLISITPMKSNRLFSIRFEVQGGKQALVVTSQVWPLEFCQFEVSVYIS